MHLDLSDHWFGTNNSSRNLSGNCKIVLDNESLNIQSAPSWLFRPSEGFYTWQGSSLKLINAYILWNCHGFIFATTIDDNGSSKRQMTTFFSFTWNNWVSSVSACITLQLLDENETKTTLGCASDRCVGTFSLVLFYRASYHRAELAETRAGHAAPKIHHAHFNGHQTATGPWSISLITVP